MSKTSAGFQRKKNLNCDYGVRKREKEERNYAFVS